MIIRPMTKPAAAPAPVRQPHGVVRAPCATCSQVRAAVRAGIARVVQKVFQYRRP